MRTKILCLLGVLVLFAGTAHAGAQEDVTGTLQKYLQALEAGDVTTVQGIYTPDTAQMMAKRPVSSGMMAHEATTIKGCGQMLVLVKKSRAVVAFPHGSKQCTPYFLRLTDGGWNLDFATMMHVIRFDGGNNWWIDRTVKNPYGFAFQ